GVEPSMIGLAQPNMVATLLHGGIVLDRLDGGWVATPKPPHVLVNGRVHDDGATGSASDLDGAGTGRDVQLHRAADGKAAMEAAVGATALGRGGHGRRQTQTQGQGCNPHAYLYA